MKRLKPFLLLSFVALLLFGCAANTETPTDTQTEEETVSSELNLESINEFLNTSVDMGPGSIANQLAVIPFDHIDGPRNESEFYALVNYKYVARDYIKYQVTYLSCTCRAASMNYWQTAYVELTLPESKTKEDVSVRYLSFDKDSQGEYNGGFWGDSNPTPSGVTYETYKKEYIPYFINKDFGYISTLSVVEDIDLADYQADGRDAYEIDTFTGSSVSTNNIIRMLNSVIEYHMTDAYFTE